MNLLETCPRGPIIVEAGPNWVDIGTFSIILLAALGALFELVQITRGRHAQVMADLFRRRDEPRMIKIRQEIYRKKPEDIQAKMKKLFDDGEKDYFEWMVIPDFFEDLSILVTHKAVSLKLANAFLGGAIVKQWELWSPWIRELRGRRKEETAKSETLYANWERVAQRISTKYRRPDP